MTLGRLLKNRAVRRQINLFGTFANWWVYYAEKIGLAGLPLTFLTRQGILVRVPRDLYPEFKSIFLREHYLEGLVLPLRVRPVIVDIGANVGFFSLFAVSKWEGRVFSYEPVGANYDEMVKSVRANPGIEVKCVRAAVSGETGWVEIFCGGEPFPTTAKVGKGDGEVKGETVRAVTLLEIMEEEGLSVVDLLKMDCEGSEFSILYGSTGKTLERIGQMAIEVHPDPADERKNASALSAFLASAGFRVATNDRGTYLWAQNRKDAPCLS